MGKKIKIWLLLNHFLFIFGIFKFHPANLWLTVVGYLFINKIGVECGYHRLFSHQAYRTGNFRKFIILYLGTLCGIGSSIAWVGVHRLHHRYADTDKDPHGNLPAWRIWLTFWREFTISPQSVRDLITDRQHLFFHKHYFKILIGTYLIIGALSSQALMFGVAGASVFAIHVAGLVNILGHRSGERRYPTGDQSRNHMLLNLILAGNGLHNNHHAKPKAWDFRTEKSDIDVQANIIKWFLLVDKDEKGDLTIE